MTQKDFKCNANAKFQNLYKKKHETDEIQGSSPWSRTKMLGRPVNRFQEAKVRLACYTAFEDNLVDVEHPYQK